MSRQTLHEDANTPAATLNELGFAYLLNGSQWWDPAMRDLYRAQQQRVSAAERDVIQGRTVAMVQALHDFVGETSVRAVSWVGRDRTSLHPADVMVTWASGRVLGVSLKATASRSDDVGFANPGLVRLETALGVGLREYRDRVEAKLIRDHGLPAGYTARRDWLQAHPRVAVSIAARGVVVLGRIRDAVIRGLEGMSDARVRDYLLRDWLQSDPELDPPYVIVVGRGVSAPFTADVRDPLVGPVVRAVQRAPLAFRPVGQGSIAVWGATVPVLGIRIKWAKSAFASSLEVVGEPPVKLAEHSMQGFGTWRREGQL